MNITIRNIPDDVIEKIRTLSKKEKRSLNSEILMILEKSVEEKIENDFHKQAHLNKETQIKIWEKLAGEWEDSRSTKEIIDDIYESRSLGREVDL